MSETEKTPDSHDLEKLDRWHEGLVCGAEDSFPVCALFLASGKDRRAHDVFRTYRSAFEELEAGFHNLVIFGQHGAATTCTSLMLAFGISDINIPSLVLIGRGKRLRLHTTTLPEGALADEQQEETNNEVPWQQALEMIRRSVVEGSELALDGLEGLKQVDFSDETLVGTIVKVKSSVESV